MGAGPRHGKRRKSICFKPRDYGNASGISGQLQR